MKAFKLVSVSVLLAAAIASAGEKSEYVTKEVTGEAAIIKGDKVKAKEEAKKKALREAVEQVAGVVLQSDQQMKNNTLVRDMVYAKSEGFVRKYDVLSEKEEAGVMKVTVKAEVGMHAIDMELSQIRDLVAELGKRSIAVVLQEQTVAPDGTYTSKGIFTSELNKLLKNDGWKVVQIAGKDDVLKVGAAAGHGTATDKEVDASAADFLLVGKVGFKELRLSNSDSFLKSTNSVQVASATGQGTGPIDANALMGPSVQDKNLIFPVQGDYSMQVFVGGQSKAREVLAEISGALNIQGMASDGGPKVRKVNQIISYDRTSADLSRVEARMIADRLRLEIAEYLRDARQNGRLVSISVLGLGDFKSAQAFKESMKKIGGVKEVSGGSLAKGKATFDVRFAGTTEELAEKMSGVAFNRKPVSVTGADATSMELTVK